VKFGLARWKTLGVRITRNVAGAWKDPKLTGDLAGSSQQTLFHSLCYPLAGLCYAPGQQPAGVDGVMTSNQPISKQFV